MRLFAIQPGTGSTTKPGGAGHGAPLVRLKRIMNPNGVPQQWADETLIHTGVFGRDVSLSFLQVHHVAIVEPRWGSVRSICNLGCAVAGDPRLCCGTALRLESPFGGDEKSPAPCDAGLLNQSIKTDSNAHPAIEDYFLLFFVSDAFASSRAA